MRDVSHSLVVLRGKFIFAINSKMRLLCCCFFLLVLLEVVREEGVAHVLHKIQQWFVFWLSEENFRVVVTADVVETGQVCEDRAVDLQG